METVLTILGSVDLLVGLTIAALCATIWFAVDAFDVYRRRWRKRAR